jgi:ATP-dependent Clp endopeptidase proteolytic subunit ClpP
MMWKYNGKLKNNASGGECGEITVIKAERDTSDTTNSNVLYFYRVVEPDGVMDLCQKIDALSTAMRMVQITYNLPAPPPIHLHIHTEGGDIMSGLALFDKISRNPVPIYTYCEGMVASAGTLLSVAGAKRYITANSCMLIHQLQGELWGNYEKLKDEAQNTELLMGLIRKIYNQRTKMSDSLIDEILKHDLYMSSDICLAHGLVDEIL